MIQFQIPSLTFLPYSRNEGEKKKFGGLFQWLCSKARKIPTLTTLYPLSQRSSQFGVSLADSGGLQQCRVTTSAWRRGLWNASPPHTWGYWFVSDTLHVLTQSSQRKSFIPSVSEFSGVTHVSILFKGAMGGARSKHTGTSVPQLYISNSEQDKTQVLFFLP